MPRKPNTTPTIPRRRPAASNGRPKSTRPAPAALEEPGTLESEIVTLATTGKLASAARKAVAAQRKRGIPVTYKRGDKIIKQHAGGREEVLGKVDRPRYVLPQGVRIIPK